MKDKKHIDSLFKDRFKNFEASPSPAVWDNIHAQLQNEKEDRKVIPLWFKIAGVAALLALLFTVGNIFFNPSEITPNPEFTNTDKVINEEGDVKNDIILEEKVNTTEIASEDDKIDNSINNSEENKNDNLIKKTPINNTNRSETVVASENTKTKNSNTKISTSEKKNSLLIKNSEADKLIEKVISEKTATAIETNKNENNIDSNIPTSENDTESLIKKNTNIPETTKTDEAVSDINNSETEEKNTEVEESDKPSIFDAIEDKNNTEEAVASNDNEPDNRWDVTPNFAPVFYNSLEDGSSIDPSFADNAQSGDVNFSYGVQVAYNVTDKLSVRSGVNNVNLSYTTKGIELGTGPVSAALKSIDYGNKSVVLSAYDKGTLANSSGGADDPFGNVTPKSTNGEAEINQKINYYEIPLELKYSLVNNKFGVNLIGGLSTLFLGNNEISVNAGNFESILGEANNLSTVSFTTNVGVGLNYKFSKKFMFNIEPMFKYQLNPYTDSSVNYKPYYIGIYSGLSFKF